MTPIQKAVAAALAASIASGAAHAIDISLYASENAAGRVTNVYVSGSTAVNIALMYSALGKPTAAGLTALCSTTQGQADLYSDNGIAAAGASNPHAQWMVYCYANPALHLTGTATEIALFKESTLGSQNGSIPLYTNAMNGSGSNYLAFINPAAGATGCTTGVVPTGMQSALVTHQNCSFTTFVPAVNITGGVSDVEAPLVGANPTDVANYLQGAPGLQVVWALPVNNTFYRALQVAQGISGNGASGVPSLSKAQVSGIFARTLKDGSQFVSAANTSIAFPDATETLMAICRREFGSGTEASAEVFWLTEGCGSGGANASNLTMPSEDTSNIIEETSTGNIKGCLTAFDGSGSVTDYLGHSYATNGPRPAIGIISSENPPATFALGPTTPTATLGGMGVIAVDGALPTLENAANGFYPFFSEDVLYNISPTVDSGALYSGNPALVWNQVKANIGTPDFLADGDSGYNNYFGQSGDLSPPSIYASSSPPHIPATAATVSTSPVGAFTKSDTASGSPNNCDPAAVYFGLSTPTFQWRNQ